MKNKNNKKMMAIGIKASRHEKGFAMVEVVLAALVMAVGSIAFLHLQSISLKNSNNNYSRTQAMVLSSGFVDRLRSNRPILLSSTVSRAGHVMGNAVSTPTALPQSNTDCQSGSKPVECATAVLDYQRYLTRLQMQGSFPGNRSLLCYTEESGTDAQKGYFRVTFLWRDNIGTKTALTAAACPASFDAKLSLENKDNSVTTYVQI